MQRRLVIAGTSSGVGKTTLTIGLMAALKKKGYVVQGFKCGPDYIDPTYHTAVTGRVSRNVDGWMFEHDTLKEIFSHGSVGADISIIEGVMGLFDGRSPLSNEGSTAEVSQILQAPIVLVVNCSSMARSAAATVKGYQTFAEGVHIVSVIANKVGSVGHYQLVKEAVEQECGIPVIGYLQQEDLIEIPERHLGLVPSIERGELTPLYDKLADLISSHIDVEQLVKLSECPDLEVEPKLFTGISRRHNENGRKRPKIAIAKDAAFHFYYPENIELLEAYGAKCVYFSPLAGELLPEDVDGLYIGGGFPEEFAQRLAENEHVKKSIKERLVAGLPTLAECGGFMYLTDSIEDTEGNGYPMIGFIPGKVKMQKKLAALGYREIIGVEGNFLLGPDQKAKGHEFHYSTFQQGEDLDLPSAYKTKGMRGTKKEGYIRNNVVAGYTHIHFASNPDMVRRWLDMLTD